MYQTAFRKHLNNRDILEKYREEGIYEQEKLNNYEFTMKN